MSHVDDTRGTALLVGGLCALVGACGDGAETSKPADDGGQMPTHMDASVAPDAGYRDASGDAAVAPDARADTDAQPSRMDAGVDAGQSDAGASDAGSDSGHNQDASRCDTTYEDAPDEDGGVEGCATTYDVPGACKTAMTGVFAIRHTLDVWWQDDTVPPLFEPGRGTVELWLQADVTEICADGSSGVASIRPCGIAVPLLEGKAECAVYQLEVPAAVWDAATIPVRPSSAQVTGFNPGNTLSITTTMGLYGVLLDDPRGAWPASNERDDIGCACGMGSSCFLDHDGDGRPGIQARMANVGQVFSVGTCGPSGTDVVYRGVPVNALNALDPNEAKVDRLSVGLRMGVGGRAVLGTGCGGGVDQSDSPAPELRVAACRLEDDSECDADELAYVDGFFPTFEVLGVGEAPPTSVTTLGPNPMSLDQTPSVGPISSVVRLGDTGASFACSDVRQTAFPAVDYVPGSATFGAVWEEIFKRSCNELVACHGSQVGMLQMLDKQSTYDALVGHPAMGVNLTGEPPHCRDSGLTRVVPGNPANSLLMQKLDGTQTCGDKMPPTTDLEPAEIEQVRMWIQNGAISD